MLHMVQKSEQYTAQMRELAPDVLSTKKKTYDLPAHTVTVTEINSVDLTNAGGTYLGLNTVCYTTLHARTHARTHTHTYTHTHLMAPFPGLPGWASTRKIKPIWILLKQETVSGSGISWPYASLHLAPDR